ncbi:MAG: C40 family peptidase [Clostridia bacterium]|nr:C40 family peptidase [Clostridia bacterium]
MLKKLLAIITVAALVLCAACAKGGQDTDILTEPNRPASNTEADKDDEIPGTDDASEEPASAEDTTEKPSEEDTTDVPSAEDTTEAKEDESSSGADETEPTEEPDTEPTTKEAEEPDTKPAPADPNNKGEAIAATVKGLIGKTFEFGATGPETFDNSGLVYYCYKENGVDIPRKTTEMANAGQAVAKDQLAPGDIVLFCLEEGGTGADFAGVYVGDGVFVSCNNENVPTGTHNLSGFWAEHFLTGRRMG